MLIRSATPADTPAIAQLFTDAVHTLAADHYDAAQRAAWAPRPPDLGLWTSRLQPIEVRVAAEDAGSPDALLGFIGFELNGHIDLMFTSPAAARRGVASQLLRHAEDALQSRGVSLLFTEASLVSHPFFERHGYRVKEEQQVELRGALFRRFAMVKNLGE